MTMQLALLDGRLALVDAMGRPVPPTRQITTTAGALVSTVETALAVGSQYAAAIGLGQTAAAAQATATAVAGIYARAGLAAGAKAGAERGFALGVEHGLAVAPKIPAPVVNVTVPETQKVEITAMPDRLKVAKRTTKGQIEAMLETDNG